MNDQLNAAGTANPSESSGGTVELVVDYGNGARKSFANIPWSTGLDNWEMDVVDALAAARYISPGLTFRFAMRGVDRGGRDMGSVVSIDDMGSDQGWSIFVNDENRGSEIRRITPASVSTSGTHPIKPGDVVTFRLEGAS